jgi:hypothetical protein
MPCFVNLREFESEVLHSSNLPLALACLRPERILQLSFSIVRIIIALLPWLELICELCLVFRWAVREAAAITPILLSLFIAHAFAYRKEDCQSFFFPTVISSQPWWWHPLWDGLFLRCRLYLVWRAFPTMEELLTWVDLG